MPPAWYPTSSRQCRFFLHLDPGFGRGHFSRSGNKKPIWSILGTLVTWFALIFNANLATLRNQSIAFLSRQLQLKRIGSLDPPSRSIYASSVCPAFHAEDRASFGVL